MADELLELRPVGSLGHLASVRGEPGVAERRSVADGVDDEEVLVLEREPHHPLRQRGRVGDAGVADLGVQLRGGRAARPPISPFESSA